MNTRRVVVLSGVILMIICYLWLEKGACHKVGQEVPAISVGLGRSNAEPSPLPFDLIVPNMTKVQVEKLLGHPQENLTSPNGLARWFYYESADVILEGNQETAGLSIGFKDGAVIDTLPILMR